MQNLTLNRKEGILLSIAIQVTIEEYNKQIEDPRYSGQLDIIMAQLEDYKNLMNKIHALIPSNL